MEPSFARTVLAATATVAAITFALGWIILVSVGVFLIPAAGYALGAATLALLVSPAFERARPYLAGAGLGVFAGLCLYGFSVLAIMAPFVGG